MANDIGNDLLSPRVYSKRLQHLLKNNLVSGAIANFEERAGLTYGYRVSRPYLGDVYTMDYTRNTAPTFQDMVATDEYLTVDQAKITALYIDDIDSIQNKWSARDAYTSRSAYQMRNTIDQAFLANVSSALLTSGAGVSLTTSNIFQEFSEGKAALWNNGCEDDKPWCAVVDADTVSVIEQVLGFNGFKTSDEVLKNGYGIGNYLGNWMGLEMFRSQNLPTTVAIVWSNDPSDAETFILNGVTFTFKSTLGSTAGNVLIDGGSDVDVTIGTNLVAAINGTAVGSIYIQLSAADRAKLEAQNVTASYVAGTNTLTITAAGKMTLGGTQTLGVAGTQTMSLMIGQMGAIDLVIQKDVMIHEDRVTDGRQGVNLTTFALYGTKMFREGAQRTYKLTANK